MLVRADLFMALSSRPERSALDRPNYVPLEASELIRNTLERQVDFDIKTVRRKSRFQKTPDQRNPHSRDSLVFFTVAHRSETFGVTIANL